MKISLALCENWDMTMIQTKEECEKAALSLALSDTTAVENERDDRPYGCIYASNDWLAYSLDGSPFTPANCGSQQGSKTYDCICKNVPGEHYFRGLAIFLNH